VKNSALPDLSNDRRGYSSISMLYPFFGRLPWYFPYFIHTCKYNPTIDFVIFTDNDPPAQLPVNVIFVYQTLSEFKKLASEKLKLDVQVEPQPYKFCDLRPAFGIIFEDYISDYDFWGHGDTDVIFGDIRNFLTEEVLGNYDLICLRSDYMSSWFTIYRNSTKLNALFKNSKDYQKVFLTEKYYNFDETNFTFFEFAHRIPYQLVESEIESMTKVVKRLHEEGYIRAYFDMHAIEGKPGKTKWVNGKLIYKDKYEVMLYHLLELKHVYKPAISSLRNPDTFHISPTRMYFPKSGQQ